MFDWEGVLLIQINIDDFVQDVAPASIRATVLYIVSYHVLAGRPDEWRLYIMLTCKFIWPHMTNDANPTVADSQSRTAQKQKNLSSEKITTVKPEMILDIHGL